MLRKTKITVFILMFITTSLFALPASASVGYKLLSVPQCSQEGWSWCWAACEQSVLGWFGINASQYDIVATIYSNPDPYSQSQGATCIQIRNSLTSNWNLNATSSSSAPLSTTIKSQINNNQPIISSRSAHAQVVRGYYQNTETNQSDIYYMEPDDGEYYYSSWGAYTSNWVATVKDIYVIQ